MTTSSPPTIHVARQLWAVYRSNGTDPDAKTVHKPVVAWLWREGGPDTGVGRAKPLVTDYDKDLVEASWAAPSFSHYFAHLSPEEDPSDG